MIDSIPALDTALAELRLVEPHLLDEARRVLGEQFYQPRELGRHLLQAGLVTAFQVNQLLQGRGKSLMLGPYMVLERIGAGGMGEVFKARDRRLHRLVALKVMQAEQIGEPSTVRRFVLEAQAAAQLSHPNIVVVHDAGQQDDIHFLAMEYIDGIDLGRLVLQAGPLPVQMACDFMRQACAGLEHAHEHGQIHRDIKPANLLVSGPPRSTPKWEGDRARIEQYAGGTLKILDMGLVRLQTPLPGRSGETPLTHHGVVIGTMDYLAPEQAKNPSSVDARADLYSLGCTMYHLLSGQPPFPGGMPVEKLLRHQSDQPVPLLALRPDVPVEVQSIVARLMAKRPEDRFDCAAQAAAALATFTRQGAPTVADIPILPASVLINANPRSSLPGFDEIPPTRVITRPIRPPSRSRRGWPAVLAVAIALLLLALAAVFWLPAPRGAGPNGRNGGVAGVDLDDYLPDDAIGVVGMRPTCLSKQVAKQKLQGVNERLASLLPPMPGLGSPDQAEQLRLVLTRSTPGEPLLLARGKLDPALTRGQLVGLTAAGNGRFTFTSRQKSYDLLAAQSWLAVSASTATIDDIAEPEKLGPDEELVAMIARARKRQDVWLALQLRRFGKIPPFVDKDLEKLLRPLLEIATHVEGGLICTEQEVRGKLRFRTPSAQMAKSLKDAIDDVKEVVPSHWSLAKLYNPLFELFQHGQVTCEGQDIVWNFWFPGRSGRPEGGTVGAPGGK